MLYRIVSIKTILYSKEERIRTIHLRIKTPIIDLMVKYMKKSILFYICKEILEGKYGGSRKK